MLRKIGFAKNKKENLGDLYELLVWNFRHLKEDMPNIFALKDKYPDKVCVYNSADEALREFISE